MGRQPVVPMLSLPLEVMAFSNDLLCHCSSVHVVEDVVGT